MIMTNNGIFFNVNVTGFVFSLLGWMEMLHPICS